KPGTAGENTADGRLRVGIVIGQRLEKTARPLLRIDRAGPAGDSAQLARNANGVVEIAELVDEFHAEGLLAGEDAAVGDFADVGLGQLALASRGNGANELRVQLEHDRLKVRAFGVGEILIRRACRLHRAAGDRLRL